MEEFCFCSYDFCNSTNKTSSSLSTLAFISLIFNYNICQNSSLSPSSSCFLLFIFGLFSYVTCASCLGYLALASLPFLGAILTNRWWPSIIDAPPNPVTILNKYITGCLIVLSSVLNRIFRTIWCGQKKSLDIGFVKFSVGRMVWVLENFVSEKSLSFGQNFGFATQWRVGAQFCTYDPNTCLHPNIWPRYSHWKTTPKLCTMRKNSS